MAAETERSLTDISLNQVTAGRILVPVFILVVWEILTLGLGADLIPSPVTTVGTIYQGFTQGSYLPNLVNTLETVVLGFLIAAVLGFVFGIIMGTYSTVYDVFESYALNIYAIPKIALFPIFLFIFKLGMDQKIAFGAFHGFFPMLIITMSAVREVPDIYTDVGRSLRVSNYQMARYILFPFLLVQLVVGFRLAFSLTFLGVLLSELFAAKSGIGLELQHAMANFNTDQIIAIVTVLMLVAFLVNLGFYTIQQSLEKRWNLTVEDTI